MSENTGENVKSSEKEPMTEEGKQMVKTYDTVNDEVKRKSMRNKVMDARQQSESKIGFMSAMLQIIVGSVVGLIALAFANIISIAQIVIGSIYIHDCRLRPGIPIVLIINGSIGVLESFAESIIKTLEKNVWSKRSVEGSNSNTKRLLTIGINLLRLYAIGSFIAWCVLVYGSDEPEFGDTESDHYCNRTLYLFSFWLLTVYFIVIAFAVCCCCCCCFFATKTRDI